MTCPKNVKICRFGRTVRALLAEPAGEEAVVERLEDEVLGGAVVAGLDQGVVKLGQEGMLQLAGLLLQGLEGFCLF